MITAVTFDFWWTLYNGNTAGGDQWRLHRLTEILGAAGYRPAPAALATAVAAVRAANLRLQEDQGLDCTPEEQVEKCLDLLGLPPRLVPDLLAAWTGPLLVERPEPIPGARTVLAELARHYRLAVICNTGATPGSVLRQLLAADGLADHFQVLTFSNEHGVAKPNPEIYRLTLAAVGVTPDAALHVGDNPLTDVAGARGAGLRAVWFNSQGLSGPAPEANGVITSLAELPALLAHLSR